MINNHHHPYQAPLRHPLKSVPKVNTPKANQPQFSGITAAIGLLENRFTELVLTDVVGMGMVRTGIEYYKRGSDAARENSIREATGTFFNLFGAGVFSRMFIKLLGNSLEKFNPKWVDQKSWITAPLLDREAFGKRYMEALQKANSIPEARELFIRNVLKDIKNTNKDMATTAFDAALGKNASSIEKMASQGAYKGQLTEDALDELVRALGHKGSKNGPLWEQPLGTYNFEKMVDERLKLSNKNLAEMDAKKLSSLRAKLRMKLSLAHHGKEEKEIIHNLVEMAKRGGLSEVVDMGSVKAENIEVVLRGLRNALHEIVDKGTEGLADNPNWKEEAAKRTFDSVDNKVKGFLPQAEDGLISYISKSKRLFTYTPILFTIVTGVTVAFINNWYTKKKHGGEVFFPGEGNAGRTPKAGQPNPSLPDAQNQASNPLNSFNPQTAIDPEAVNMRRAQLFNALEQQIRQKGAQ